MSHNAVSIIIVTWNSMDYIPDCLRSLKNQTFEDFSVTVIDNGSTDGVVHFLRTEYPNVSVLENFKNIGFSKANNKGIQISRSPYVLIMNPDVILDPTCLKHLYEVAEEKTDSASFGPKLLRLFQKDLDPSEHLGGLKTLEKSTVIDSAGLLMSKSFRVVNRGEGQNDENQFERANEVFGISGSCVLYRKSALDEVFIKNEYFDQDFDTYKEDVDLAWRLQMYGWKSYYVPKAVGYHHRGYRSDAISSEVKDVQKTKTKRKDISKTMRYNSFKNHHLMLVKNLFVKNAMQNFFPFMWREAKLIGYMIIFEPFLIKSCIQFFKELPYALIKRKVIMSHRKIDAKDMKRWFK